VEDEVDGVGEGCRRRFDDAVVAIGLRPLAISDFEPLTFLSGELDRDEFFPAGA
jgi:hypothetical protein